MTRGRFPGTYAFAQVVARTLGWMTSVATMVILAFVINRWPGKGGAIAAGIVGCAIALLNDSWIVASTINRSLGFPRMTPARGLLHDLFALAICLGGIVMIIFSRYTYEANGFASLDSKTLPGDSGDTDVYSRDGFSQSKMLAIAVWFLTTIVIWRFILIIWGCFECFAQFRRIHARMRRDMIEARS